MSNKTNKVWNIIVQGRPCSVEMKNNRIHVNQDDGINLNKLPSKTLLFNMHTAYYIMIDGVGLTLYIGVTGGPILVMDYINCATGEKYVYEKFPKWGYVFFVLHMVNFINGAIGVGFAMLGCYMTVTILENNRTKTGTKVILSLLTLVGILFATIVAAFAFTVVLNILFL